MEEKKRKKLPLGVVLLLILLAITVLLCSVVLGLWLHGRSSINQPDTGAEDESTIVYDGKTYRYRQDMINILLMGIDADGLPTAGSHDQADVLILACLDPDSGEMNLVSLSRDILCDMEMLQPDGTVAQTRGQLALAYAYGDGLHESCRLTCDAVSGIFYGLPIHGYASYYMSGIADLNDAVGGVTVTVIEDFPFSNVAGFHNMIEGHQVKLKGYQAELYIRARLEEQADANELRMVRQKQYMMALIDRCLTLVREKPTDLLGVYNAVMSYVLTNLSFSRIAYLATEAVDMQWDGEVHSLTGELSLNEHNEAVLVPDQAALLELMIDTFYEEVSEETETAE